MKKLLIAAAAIGMMSAPAFAGSFGFETGGSATGTTYAGSSSSFGQTAGANAGVHGGFRSDSFVRGSAGAVVLGSGGLGIGGASGDSFTLVQGSFGADSNGSTNFLSGSSAANAGFTSSFGTGFGFSWSN